MPIPPKQAAHPLGYDGDMFTILDERHSEPQGRFASFGVAMAELKRRATLPWDQEPNRAPCVQWRTCGRAYAIVEHDE